MLPIIRPRGTGTATSTNTITVTSISHVHVRSRTCQLVQFLISPLSLPSTLSSCPPIVLIHLHHLLLLLFRLQSLKALVENNRDVVAAVGEMGLDYDRLHFCPKDVQAKFFQRQVGQRYASSNAGTNNGTRSMASCISSSTIVKGCACGTQARAHTSLCPQQPLLSPRTPNV